MALETSKTKQLPDGVRKRGRKPGSKYDEWVATITPEEYTQISGPEDEVRKAVSGIKQAARKQGVKIRSYMLEGENGKRHAFLIRE